MLKCLALVLYVLCHVPLGGFNVFISPLSTSSAFFALIRCTRNVFRKRTFSSRRFVSCLNFYLEMSDEIQLKVLLFLPASFDFDQGSQAKGILIKFQCLQTKAMLCCKSRFIICDPRNCIAWLTFKPKKWGRSRTASTQWNFLLKMLQFTLWVSQIKRELIELTK